MKRTERRHLKRDELASSLQQTFDTIDQNRRRITAALVAVVVVLAGIGGYLWWQRDREAKAGQRLGEALAIAEAPVAPVATTGDQKPPAGSYPSERARNEAALPKLLVAAEAYPRTSAGLSARYRAAATLVALGRDDEAAKRYQEVIDLAGADMYGRMARLGLAEVKVRQKQYEAAINTYKELSLNASDSLPVDGVLMQLGRTYVLAGRTPEAVQTFKRITDEFPTSLYAADARKELDVLAPGSNAARRTDS